MSASVGKRMSQASVKLLTDAFLHSVSLPFHNEGKARLVRGNRAEWNRMYSFSLSLLLLSGALFLPYFSAECASFLRHSSVQGFSMTSRRFFPLLLCLIMSVLGSTALVTADCAPAPSGGNDTIDCTGTDSDGVDAGAGNDSIHIEPTAVVGDEATDEVNGGDGNDGILNDGTVIGDINGDNGND